MAGEKSGVGVDQPQRLRILDVGELEAAQRFDGVAERVGDQARVIVAEHRDIGVGDAVDGIQRMVQVARAGVGPGSQQQRGDVAGLAGVARGELGAHGGVLAIAQRANRESEPGQRIGGLMA